MYVSEFSWQILLRSAISTFPSSWKRPQTRKQTKEPASLFLLLLRLALPSSLPQYDFLVDLYENAAPLWVQREAVVMSSV
jgi:hypothetical protein